MDFFPCFSSLCADWEMNHYCFRDLFRYQKVSLEKDINPGEELLCDYVEFGKPPQWLANFVKKHNIPLAFEGFNEFVTN